MNNEITIDGVVYVRKDSCKCPFMNKGNENIGKKYGFTGETLNYKGHILHRIFALKDFWGIRKGDFGGWIEKEDNLSQKGNCWVFGNAGVFGDAEVHGNAWVFGNAKVGGNAKVYGNAKVGGNANVFGNAEVFGNVKVYGNAWVFGNTNVYRDAEVVQLRSH